MVIKLDLEKAYDKVNWSFLEQTLHFFNIPNQLVKLIMECVKCSRPRILWNGEPLEEMHPNCGLRQGDPLSPYLFVLCMERLSYLIEERVERKKWQPLSPCRGGPKISHLFFADDLMLMAKATTKNARCIDGVLREFCCSSGLKINLNKSKVFFANVEARRTNRQIANILSIGRTPNLGKYLGVPLIHGRVTPSIFREVIDRVSGRLSEWKAKLLSLAGRATLIQSVTAAIPNHLMQSTWLPTSTCDQLDRLNRNFLWSSNHTQRKIHLVGWQKVTKAKSCGGLGIRPTRKANIALLAKVGWKTMVGENTLWGATFRQKYLKRGEITDYKPKNEDSYVWKGVVKSSKAVTGCFKWRVGNGKTISLWFDKWVGKAPLYTLVDGEIKDDEVGWKVEEILGPNGIWEVDKIQSKLSKEARDLIKAMPIPLFGDQEDIRIWDGSPNGKFSCKSAYESILDGEVLGTGPQSNCWTWLWKIQSSNRLKHFIWLCLHGSIATNSLRHTRKLSDSAVCTRCNIHEESIVHALRDCPNAQSVWEFLIAPTQFLRFKCLDPVSWIRENLTHEKFENIILPSIPWPVIFLATVWSIWKSRNKFIFQNIREHTRQVIFAIKILAEDLSRGFAPKKGKEQKIKDHTRWLKPGHGWVKLNTDGSVFTATNSAAAGGLIRDDKGEWIIGFTQHLGNVSITVAELLAVREGLKLAWERRVPRIEVEIDSEVVVKLIRDANVVGHPLEVIIHDCRRLLGMPWESRISHIGRSGNTCADALARMGHGATNSCCILKDPPPEVLSCLEADGSI